MVQQNERLLLGIWSRTEKVDVAIWAQAPDNSRAGSNVDRSAQMADGYFAVIAHANPRLLAKHERPPRTGCHWSQNGPFFGYRLITRCLRRNSQFAVNLVSMGMR